MRRHRPAPRPIAPSLVSSTPTGVPPTEPRPRRPGAPDMSDSPDPLGKRALFWAPAERDEGGPRRASERDAPGKHALFSDEARASVTKTRPVTPIEPGASRRPRDMRPGAARG